jgi:hypothetical protein
MADLLAEMSCGVHATAGRTVDGSTGGFDEGETWAFGRCCRA